jgi:signal transduction histidine kinase
VQEALDTLRDIASGVFPAVLTERGTAAALDAYADRRGLRTVITTQGPPRYPPPVEAAAYFCAVALLRERSPAQPTEVRLRCDGGTVRVEAVGPARSHEATLQLMRDRVEAMGGTLDEWSDAAGGWVTWFELPLTDTAVGETRDEGVPT